MQAYRFWENSIRVTLSGGRDKYTYGVVFFGLEICACRRQLTSPSYTPNFVKKPVGVQNPFVGHGTRRIFRPSGNPNYITRTYLLFYL